ncbi:D-glycero-alpha-D-manno-heptose-1,7-bisphosphate 7-phosphatase [Mesoterricola sediminis]|uniref:D-glycero-alpha-D-manno-heptose-1,7-bisphosphate 7-phosphatase n=1 Tax=Mesoterricola sediminis TaxID=2927980 RepID=UPI001FAFBEB1|nr:HAD family hydrolase [Mesoterricola sediminis]
MPAHGSARPAVFIDRDGTLNEEVGYLHRPEDVVLVPGSARALARVNALGIPVVVVTNQAGIGKGKYGWDAFRAVSARVGALLAEEGARVDAVYAAPHHPDGVGDYAHPDHPDRKPNPGMLLRAAEELGLDLARSWMIGDKAIDLGAARNAGCRAALVLTGYGRGVDPALADLVAADLPEALDRILALGFGEAP